MCISKEITLIELLRGTSHDGPGLRATVFVKGCPLSCNWCQNPEGIKLRQEIWWERRKCIGCGNCSGLCDNLHTKDGAVNIKRDTCIACGGCVDDCPAQSLSFVGTKWTEDTLIREVLKDRHYYRQSGGGVTISGGEPLLYADFLESFLRRLRAEGIHIALDTCGHGTTEDLLRLMKYSDMLLYDIKLIDNEQHLKFTGKCNQLILDNLRAAAEYIRHTKKKEKREISLWIRTPLIPEATAVKDNIRGITEFIISDLSDVIQRYELCAFNSACSGKYHRLGQSWVYDGFPLMNQNFVNVLREEAIKCGIPEDILHVTGIMIKDRLLEGSS